MPYTNNLTGTGRDFYRGDEATLPVAYFVARVDSLGPRAYARFDGSPTILTKVGWVRFGDPIDLGDGLHDYWNEPIWINEYHFEWTPQVNVTFTASIISWHFDPGTSVHIYVSE